MKTIENIHEFGIRDIEAKISDKSGNGFLKEDQIEKIKSYFMEIAGIEEIEISLYLAQFDDNLHMKFESHSDPGAPNGTIRSLNTAGYMIGWSGKILRKCGASVNYRQ